MDDLKGFKQPDRVLAFFDSADREKHRRPRRQAEPSAQRQIRCVGRWRKALHIHAITDMMRIATELAPKPPPPHAADHEEGVGRSDRAQLQGRETLVIERVDMVYGAGKALDEAALLQRRHGVSRNPILGMPDVELPVPGRFEIAEIVGDAGLDHRNDISSGGRGSNARRPAGRVAEKARARRIRRVHGRLMTQTAKRLAELERMYHAAARVGRVRQNRDAQRSSHANAPTWWQPISGSRVKSQIGSVAMPSLRSTRRSGVTCPISAAAMPRAVKRASTAGTFTGGTARR